MSAFFKFNQVLEGTSQENRELYNTRLTEKLNLTGLLYKKNFSIVIELPLSAEKKERRARKQRQIFIHSTNTTHKNLRAITELCKNTPEDYDLALKTEHHLRSLNSITLKKKNSKIAALEQNTNWALELAEEHEPILKRSEIKLGVLCTIQQLFKYP
jgi:tRNA G10  N-methylase Trm11